MNGEARFGSTNHRHVPCLLWISKLTYRRVPCLGHDWRRSNVFLGRLGQFPKTKSAFSLIADMLTSAYQLNQRAWNPALVEMGRRRE